MRLEVLCQRLFDPLCGPLPHRGTNIPAAQQGRPQERFFSSGNSSPSLLELRPLRQRMLSRRAMGGGAETRLGPCSFRMPPVRLVLSTIA